METLIKVAKGIAAKEKADKKQGSADIIKPLTITEYAVPDFTPPQKLGKWSRQHLRMILAFIELQKHKRVKNNCTIIPIATTNKRLLRICNNPEGVRQLIKNMIVIGLITVEDNTYRFNAPNKEDNKSKTYRYYYENEVKIKEFCNENNIKKYIVKNYKERKKRKSSSESLVQTFLLPEKNNCIEVRFSSKLNLIKPDKISKDKFEEYLTMLLYERYPQLAYYQMLADKINETYYDGYPELALQFIPTFTWKDDDNGNPIAVKKIGIRCTNSLCSAKKEKDGNENFYGIYKEDVIKKYELTLEKDVKSSVPRLTLSLNSGFWIDESLDMYELIYNGYISNSNEDDMIDNFSEVREHIKSLHMRAYFDTEGRIGTNARNAMDYVAEQDKATIDRELRILKKAVESAEGGHLYDSEIFFHESCIYMDVLYELLSRGFFVWQCYDAFYAKKSNVNQEEFEALTTEIIKERANEYIQREAESK